MQSSAADCSLIQCSAKKYRAVQCSEVQCSAVRCSAVQCGAVQCSAVQCSAVLFQYHQCGSAVGLQGFLAGMVEGSYCTMFGTGLVVSWIYLRFYQVIQSTVYTVHSVHCQVIKCTLYTIHCTLYTVYSSPFQKKATFHKFDTLSTNYCSLDLYKPFLKLLFGCQTSPSGLTLSTCGGKAPSLPRCLPPVIQ